MYTDGSGYNLISQASGGYLSMIGSIQSPGYKLIGRKERRRGGKTKRTGAIASLKGHDGIKERD